MKFGWQELHIMINKEINLPKPKSKKAICFGIGLVALDVVINGNPNTQPLFQAGGSCGNVMTILSFLGWKSYPIARLSNKGSSELLFKDLQLHNVKLDLITQSDDGSTPIIIHRILKDSENNPKHRYEFRIPKTNIWLPSYKPVLSNKVPKISSFSLKPKIFYLDRVSRAGIDLAKYYKGKGSIIYFEPSSTSDERQFKECLAIADILKFSNDRLPAFKDLYPSRQVSIEIETLGANGLLYRSFRSQNDNWRFLPSIHINDAKDNAGAGDWCSAGIIHALLEKSDELIIKSITINKLEQAIVFGQFLSALNCKFYGARGLMYNLNYHEINRIYKAFKKIKRIETNKFENGFILNKRPYDFLTLL